MSRQLDGFKGSVLVSILVPAHRCPELLEENIPHLLHFCSANYGADFEIILIPNPVLSDQPTLRAAQKLARQYPRVKVCPTSIRPGKGIALKEGFGMARGRRIFVIDADLPFDLSFFLEAERLLKLGFHLVTGNRRLPSSRFRIPTRVLHMVYQRALLGLLFNFCVRVLFPIRTTDTQAGIKAMTWETANEIFRRQICPRYSYDIEMFLTAQGTSRRIAELPVVLHLQNEKSTVNIARSLFVSSYWICRIFLLHLKGHYSRARQA